MTLWNLFAWIGLILTCAVAALGICLFLMAIRRAFAISLELEHERRLQASLNEPSEGE